VQQGQRGQKEVPERSATGPERCKRARDLKCNRARDLPTLGVTGYLCYFQQRSQAERQGCNKLEGGGGGVATVKRGRGRNRGVEGGGGGGAGKCNTWLEELRDATGEVQQERCNRPEV
jgi:hypothetical protein